MYGGVPDISQKTIAYQGYGDNIFVDVSHRHRLPVKIFQLHFSYFLQGKKCLDGIDGPVERQGCKAPGSPWPSML